jgi:hypothetical protein
MVYAAPGSGNTGTAPTGTIVDNGTATESNIEDRQDDIDRGLHGAPWACRPSGLQTPC